LSRTSFFVAKNRINASHVDLSFLGDQIFSVEGPLVLLNEAVQVADIDVDIAAPREALLKGFDIPCAFRKPLFSGIRMVMCLNCDRKKTVIDVKSPEDDLNSKRQGS
jgi:hypothetical protein